MLHPPVYDTNKTFDQNYREGPYHAWADGKRFVQVGEPEHTFFGHPVYEPFGVSAGPIFNSNYAQGALDKAFDILVYKTVRSREKPVHPWPNFLPLELTGDYEEGDVVARDNQDYREPLAAANSFGVPSVDPSVWIDDMRRVNEMMRKGQVTICAFEGTNWGEGSDAYIDDHAKTAKMVLSTNPRVVEMNTSCPNEGTRGLLCYDVDRMYEITSRVKEVLGSVPLVVKIGYFPDETLLRHFVERVGPVVDGIAAINTMGARIVTADGEQAFPGAGREYAGVCGTPIKWAGLDMVKRLKWLREALGVSYTIIGIGGVTTPTDYFHYRSAGADAVLAATGVIWNPYLAAEIKGLNE
jgi:dihydroorotate dehydrogenase